MFRKTYPATHNTTVATLFLVGVLFIGVLIITIAALFFDEKCDNHAIYYLLFSGILQMTIFIRLLFSGILQTTIFIIRAFNKEENFYDLKILGSLYAAGLIWGSGNNYSRIKSLVWLTEKFPPIFVIFKIIFKKKF